MNLNPFAKQPPTYANVIDTGEGRYAWRWFYWRRVHSWKAGSIWLSRGSLERLENQRRAGLRVGEYHR